MDNVEELKKRKEQLQLEREVARLERDKRIASKTQNWSWGWVAPVGLIGITLTIVGFANLNDAGIVAIFLGLPGVVAFGLKAMKS